MNKYWFKPKRIGWGISSPISWEGWLAFIIFIACIILEICFTDKSSLKGIIQLILEILATSFVFLFAVKNKVEGGLKWRNRDDEE